jgi:ABC-type Fe3+-citrate transport system substrate-binding protein
MNPEDDKEQDPMENEKFWHSTDPRSQAPKNDIIREKIMQHDQRLNQLEQSIGEQSQMINQVQQDSQMQQMQSMMQNMVMQHMWNETGMNMKPLNPYGAMGASEEDLQGSGAMNPGGMDLNDAVSEDDLKKSKT